MGIWAAGRWRREGEGEEADLATIFLMVMEGKGCFLGIVHGATVNCKRSKGIIFAPRLCRLLSEITDPLVTSLRHFPNSTRLFSCGLERHAGGGEDGLCIGRVWTVGVHIEILLVGLDAPGGNIIFCVFGSMEAFATKAWPLK